MGAFSTEGVGHGSAEGPIRGLGPVHKIFKQNVNLPAFKPDVPNWADEIIRANIADGLNALIDDLSPQLGGDLDVNNFSIISTNNGDINITPNGTGEIVLDGQAWPQTIGENSQFLQTNAMGQLAWETISACDIPLAFSTITKTSTLVATNDVILCDANATAFSVKLPLASSSTGLIFRIKKIDASENAVSVMGSESDESLIDGGVFASIENQWEVITISSNGTNWYIL